LQNCLEYLIDKSFLNGMFCQMQNQVCKPHPVVFYTILFKLFSNMLYFFMPVRLPLEVYETLEKAVGKEDATAIVRSIETAISEAIDYKWATTKEELLDAMRKEFVTKNEFIEKMNVLEEKMTGKIDFARLSLDKKFTIMFLILLFTIIILNINSIEFIAKLFGILK